MRPEVTIPCERTRHLHRTIWLASENSILQRIWPITDATINLAVSTDQATQADLARAHEVHARLVEAILNNKQREIKAEVCGCAGAVGLQGRSEGPMNSMAGFCGSVTGPL
jgi:hypothetical protein